MAPRTAAARDLQERAYDATTHELKRDTDATVLIAIKVAGGPGRVR